MKVGSLFGIAITVNVSWIFIFALVTWGLANPMGPLHLEGVGTAERIALGLSAALLFFASVLVHELAHSLLARRRGIAVKGITLFIFGGVSQFDGEAQDAPGEAWISGIGPLTSLLLGGLFYGASLAVGGSATHTGAMFAYLGIANVLLAIFNILPAYPLDGGRVMHALVWKFSGNKALATRVTVLVGRVLAALMIGYGVVESLAFGNFGGLWLTFVGGFLLQAGSSEQSGLAVKEALQDHRAGELAAPPEFRLAADASAARARGAMRAMGVRALPVFVGEHFVGIVTSAELNALSEDDLAGTYVTAVMTREPDVPRIAAAAPANDAVATLASSGGDALAVTGDGGDVLGLFTRESVVRWLAGALK
jgi:Zn-dependent protease/predicted transcriptional regulator